MMGIRIANGRIEGITSGVQIINLSLALYLTSNGNDNMYVFSDDMQYGDIVGAIDRNVATDFIESRVQRFFSFFVGVSGVSIKVEYEYNQYTVVVTYVYDEQQQETRSKIPYG